MKIISADWGGVDVTDKIYKWFVKRNEIHLSADNHYLTDTKPGVEKILKIRIEGDDGIEYYYEVNEGANLHFPQSKYKQDNAMIVTSCNRVEQVCLALSVNSRVIKEPFNLVIVDCSTPYLSFADGVHMHQSDDPYNLIKDYNYNPNWGMFDEHIKTLPNIKDYKVIHLTPRLPKQRGEATLMALGSMMASMMGSKYGLKLTGVCHLKQDHLSNIKEVVGDSDFTYIKRSSSNQPSTRVLPINNDKFTEILGKEGYSEWIDEYDFIERRLDKIGKKHNMNKWEGDERQWIVDEGIGRHDHREIIMANILKHDLQNTNDKYINKFLEGNIW
jgi:hypothetical protein